MARISRIATFVKFVPCAAAFNSLQTGYFLGLLALATAGEALTMVAMS